MVLHQQKIKMVCITKWKSQGLLDDSDIFQIYGIVMGWFKDIENF